MTHVQGGKRSSVINDLRSGLDTTYSSQKIDELTDAVNFPVPDYAGAISILSWINVITEGSVNAPRDGFIHRHSKVEGATYFGARLTINGADPDTYRLNQQSLGAAYAYENTSPLYPVKQGDVITTQVWTDNVGVLKANDILFHEIDYIGQAELPDGGWQRTQLETGVQASLGKADTAVQPDNLASIVSADQHNKATLGTDDKIFVQDEAIQTAIIDETITGTELQGKLDALPKIINAPVSYVISDNLVPAGTAITGFSGTGTIAIYAQNPNAPLPASGYGQPITITNNSLREIIFNAQANRAISISNNTAVITLEGSETPNTLGTPNYVSVGNSQVYVSNEFNATYIQTFGDNTAVNVRFFHGGLNVGGGRVTIDEDNGALGNINLMGGMIIDQRDGNPADTFARRILVPAEATPSNQLADKQFVNNAVQASNNASWVTFYNKPLHVNAGADPINNTGNILPNTARQFDFEVGLNDFRAYAGNDEDYVFKHSWLIVCQNEFQIRNYDGSRSWNLTDLFPALLDGLSHQPKAKWGSFTVVMEDGTHLQIIGAGGVTHVLDLGEDDANTNGFFLYNPTIYSMEYKAWYSLLGKIFAAD